MDERDPLAPAAAQDTAPIVDWSRTARRLATVLASLGVLILGSWLVLGAVRGTLELRLLGELVGFGLLVAFVIEFVVVGGAAVRGMLAAGARGDRLASQDVSLFPPQLTRRRRDR